MRSSRLTGANTMTALLLLALWTRASKYGIFAALTRRSWSYMGMGKHYSLKKPMCTSLMQQLLGSQRPRCCHSCILRQWSCCSESALRLQIWLPCWVTGSSAPHIVCARHGLTIAINCTAFACKKQKRLCHCQECKPGFSCLITCMSALLFAGTL